MLSIGPASISLTEAGLTAQDVSSRLYRAVQQAHETSGHWAYYNDHIGDDDSGDVVYRCDGKDMMCPYDFDKSGDGASMPVIHTDQATEVMRRTQYEPVPDDEDQYTAQMAESFTAAKLYTELPLYERFISKAERDKADDGDFAGKGKSFPILKAADVMAAVRSMGRAGAGNSDTATLKKNIIRIAKKKGFTSSLPKSWRPGASAESQRRSSGTAGSGSTGGSPGASSRGAGLSIGALSNAGRREGAGLSVHRETLHQDSLTLIESATTCETIVLREAKADYEIKLIAPGKGSSAFYPSEVLQRDGPKVFKTGTHVYLNHPTAAEEAARPEGDVANLAGVLTTDAVYHESHAKGPGLFARMKVFADHAEMVADKAPAVGMSIRAFGQQESGKTRDGVPVLKELTAAESVDIVTRAGAGGLILTEAARSADTQEDEVMSDELKTLQESNRRLLDRALRSDAKETGARLLEGISLPLASKHRVIEAVIERGLPKTDAGELDAKKFEEAITAEAQREGQYVGQLTGVGRVQGMGAAAVGADPVKAREARERQEADDKRLAESAESVFGDLMGSKEAGKMAARRGEAA